MSQLLDDVCCARFPLAALAALAGVRCARGVMVLPDGGHVWLRWPAGDEAVLRAVLPIAGLEMYVRREGSWYRLGCRLPVSGPPGEGRPLDQVLLPAPVRPLAVPSDVLRPMALRLVRDGQARPATALACSLAVLRCWADQATTWQLAAVRGARHGDRVLLLGQPLPPLPTQDCYWGRRVLVPLGFRPEPALPESALAAAIGLEDNEMALVGEAQVEVLGLDLFRPLTRAGVRLA